MAGDVGSELSRGGMVTKIEAAKIAISGGTHMVIASGKVMHPLQALAGEGAGTWFLSRQDPVTARKRWIAGTLEPKGAVIVDGGAAQALASGKSLLPAGVVRVEGRFERGDAVSIRNGAGARDRPRVSSPMATTRPRPSSGARAVKSQRSSAILAAPS